MSEYDLAEKVEELEERIEKLEEIAETEGISSDEGTIEDFVSRCNPSTHTETAVCVAYYLENNEGRQSFTSSDIKDGVKRSRNSLPSNMSDTLNNTESRGWLMIENTEDGQKHRMLTTDGKEFVEEMASE